MPDRPQRPGVHFAVGLAANVGQAGDPDDPVTVPLGAGHELARRERARRGAGQAVTACFWSLLVTWMLRGLAASWTGMVRVSTPAA